MRVLVTGLCVLAIASAARADDLQRLREENTRLRGRVEALEAENTRLRRDADPTGLATALRESARTTVRSEVDAETGRTIVETEPSLIEADAGSHSRHWIVFRAGAPTAPAGATELVVEGAASGGAYRDVPALDLALDGSPEKLVRLRYASKPVTAVRGGGATFRETVVLEVPSPVLERIAKARRIDGTLGPLRFHLTPEQLASVREFSERVGAAR